MKIVVMFDIKCNYCFHLFLTYLQVFGESSTKDGVDSTNSYADTNGL